MKPCQEGMHEWLYDYWTDPYENDNGMYVQERECKYCGFKDIRELPNFREHMTFGVAMTEQVEFERIDLEQFQLVVLTELTDELVKDFAEPPVLDLSLHARWSADTITLRVKQAVYGETLGTLEIKRPATWWQMLKEQHAPYWLNRRWPVRYDTETYDSRELYPKLALLPDEVNNRVWVKTYRHAHTEPKRS